MPPRCLIFLGPPGTGKGTQAARLSERLGLAALSSGDALRHEIRTGSNIGRQAEQYVAGGTLVPDDVITGVMLAAIDKLAAEQGFILDGFPRTLPQAAALEAGLAQRRVGIDGVLDFRLDDGAIIARLSTRRVCSQCGTTYNVRFSPPAREGVCDACGGPLTQRVDDREDVIATRLATYRRETEPLREHYRTRGLLRSVDASASPERVAEEVGEIVAGLRRVGQRGVG
jgi:adenylate kinase